MLHKQDENIANNFSTKEELHHEKSFTAEKSDNFNELFALKINRIHFFWTGTNPSFPFIFKKVFIKQFCIEVCRNIAIHLPSLFLSKARVRDGILKYKFPAHTSADNQSLKR